MNAFLRNMAVLAEGRSKRSSSWDRTGGNKDYVRIDPGQSTILAHVHGAGCINKTYATVLSMDRLWGRELVLRMYWDGEDQPSVEVPFVDFYGVTNCVERFFSSLLLAVNPGAHTTRTYGYNSYFPMPFARGMRVEVTNEGESPIAAFWYHIDYEEWDGPSGDLGRFHAQWRRENLTTPVPQPPGLWTGKNLSGAENYVILDAEGRGSYAGCVLSVNNVTGGPSGYPSCLNPTGVSHPLTARQVCDCGGVSWVRPTLHRRPDALLRPLSYTPGSRRRLNTRIMSVPVRSPCKCSNCSTRSSLQR
jgi:hypothetical protein